jgi:phage tail tube protein FII
VYFGCEGARENTCMCVSRESTSNSDKEQTALPIQFYLYHHKTERGTIRRKEKKAERETRDTYCTVVLSFTHVK